MRAAFVTAEVLAAAPDGPAEIRRLDEAGLRPVVLSFQPAVEGAQPLGLDYPTVACPPRTTRSRDEQPDALVHAASAADVLLGEAFMVCGVAEDIALATAAGCRAVLVLGAHSLSDLLGPHEPEQKDFAVAPDLATAVGYMIEERRQEAELGPFPYGSHRALDERPSRPVFTRRDLVLVLTVIISTGVAIALGIAYLLQEIYQTYQFPPVAYWLTLQFMPQTWRGILFLLIGAAGALLAQRILTSISERRRSP